MFYRSSRPREAKKIHLSAISILGDKLRRHRNKERIWKRATARLQLKSLGLAPVPVEVSN